MGHFIHRFLSNLICTSWHTREGVMSRTWMGHVTRRGDKRADVMHFCVWQDSIKCVTWLLRRCDMTPSYEWHDFFIDSFTCVTLLLHMCDMKCTSCHTCKEVTSHTWRRQWRSHVTRMKESCRTYEGVMSHIWSSLVTHMKESCHTYEGIWRNEEKKKRRSEGILSHSWSSMSHLFHTHLKHMKES